MTLVPKRRCIPPLSIHPQNGVPANSRSHWVGSDASPSSVEARDVLNRISAGWRHNQRRLAACIYAPASPQMRFRTCVKPQFTDAFTSYDMTKCHDSPEDGAQCV
jgi:hypothetical protein